MRPLDWAYVIYAVALALLLLFAFFFTRIPAVRNDLRRLRHRFRMVHQRLVKRLLKPVIRSMWRRLSRPRRTRTRVRPPSAFLDWLLRRTDVAWLEQRGQSSKLIELLARRNADLQREAVQALGRLAAIEATPVLCQLLFDSKNALYFEIVITLGQIRDPSSVPSLIRAFEREFLPAALPERVQVMQRLRKQILYTLALIASRDAVNFLIWILWDKRLMLQRTALAGLDRAGNARAITPLVQVLFHPNETLSMRLLQAPEPTLIRCEIIKTLARFAIEETALAALLRVLLDSDSRVREEAIHSLGEIGDRRALPELVQLAEEDPDPLIRLAARAAVEQIRNRLKTFAQKQLEQKEFQLITEIKYVLHSQIFWHPRLKVELMVTDLDEGYYLVKAMKKYYIKAVSESGHETWQRNLGEMMERLKVSFPEFHLYAAGMMNVPESLIEGDGRLSTQHSKVQQMAELLEQSQAAEAQSEEQLNRVEREELVRGAEASKIKGAPGMEFAKNAAEWKALRKRTERMRERLQREAREAKRRHEEALETLQQMMEERHKLLKEFKEKGAATCYVIAYSTELRVGTEAEFDILVDQALEDIRIAHVYGGFTQLLERGLRIYHEEVEFPWILHQAEAVGLFAPDHFDRFKTMDELREYVLPLYMVTAAEDIVVSGQVKEKGKRTPAKVFQAFIEKVERVPDETMRAPHGLPLSGGWVGHLLVGKELTERPFFFPLERLNHGYVSGTTGSGKSYLARVLVENALLEDVNVIIIDATKQWLGVVKPAEKGKGRLNRLGVERDLRRGFEASLYLPAEGLDLPRDLRKLLTGCSIISCKGMEDEGRCTLAAQVLELAYKTLDKESSKLKTLIVLEEAHSLLPEHVSEEAKAAAKEVRGFIDRISRESRKYGLNLMLVTQSLSDFKGEAKIVREMTNSKFFCRATDLSEINYVEGFISKETGELVKTLEPGEAVIHNPFFGPVKVFVRPPFSHVGELSSNELEEWTSRTQLREERLAKTVTADSLSPDEQRLLDLVRTYLEKNEEPVHVSRAQELLGITSKRQMQELVDGLESKRLIRSERIEGRGQPRVLFPQE